MPGCPVSLLISATQMPYRLQGPQSVLRESTSGTSTAELLQDLSDYDYHIGQRTNPDAPGSKGIAAMSFEPMDTNEPIIISYRGTKSLDDVLSDASLGLTGTIGKNKRDEAFEFYQKVRQQHPNREIIITGHSLGGHLAQYVATKAYATEPALQQNRTVSVRTFNTAPIDTAHFQQASQLNPNVFSQFVHYRLSNDVVSAAPLQNYYGNVFDFPVLGGKNPLTAHKMDAIRSDLPQDVQALQVGGTGYPPEKHLRNLNTLREFLVGARESYNVHVGQQWFASLRQGTTNKNVIDECFARVSELLKGEPPSQQAFTEAQGLVATAKTQVSGQFSEHILHVVEQNIRTVKTQCQQAEESELRDEVAHPNFNRLAASEPPEPILPALPPDPPAQHHFRLRADDGPISSELEPDGPAEVNFNRHSKEVRADNIHDREEIEARVAELGGKIPQHLQLSEPQLDSAANAESLRPSAQAHNEEVDSEEDLQQSTPHQ